MTEPEPTSYISIAEFRERGYLQEVNRRLLHPLGLALEVTMDEAGTEHLSGVWDYRTDPEGITFGGEDPDRRRKEQTIQHEWDLRAQVRQDRLGYVIQPIDECS